MIDLFYPPDTFGGYYALSLGTPLQCVEILLLPLYKPQFFSYTFKFKGYVYGQKSLSANVFGLVLKNNVTAIAIFVSTNFSDSSTSRNFIVKLFKFVGYVYCHKTLPWNNF